MKKLIHNLMYAGLFIAALSFTSCQEEFEQIGGGEGEEQEAIVAGSETANLIINTSTNDGSFDNIVDGASCFAVNFPYTVEIGSIQITIDSVEDLRLIEAIFDEFDDDVDILEFIFPITITLDDFTEIVIENAQQLRELAEECIEGGEDDDIECIDFVYPITLFTFDINEQISNEVVVNSDLELRRFFARLDDGDLVSIDFPITLISFDGTETVVNSNAELARALEMARDICDEDDDDDFNDDDFSEERFVEFFTECEWYIRDLDLEGVSNTEDFIAFSFDFDEDGTVVAEDEFGNTYEGQWNFEFTEDGLRVALGIPELMIFNREWFVYEIGENRIKFFSDDNNRIVLKRDCEDDEDEGEGEDEDEDEDDDEDGSEGDDPQTLREILGECEWVIRSVRNNGEEIDRLLGYEFQFMPEGIVTLSNRITTSEGIWEVGLNGDNIPSLLISFGNESAVSFDWPLRDLDDERLRFEVEEVGYELVLQRVCDDNAGDDDVSEIKNTLLDGLWNVIFFDNEGQDETANFDGMDFNFSTFLQVEVSIEDEPIIAGLWRVLRNADGNLRFYLNFGDDDTFGELTEPWYITEVSENRIKLVYEDEEVTTKTLVLEK